MAKEDSTHATACRLICKEKYDDNPSLISFLLPQILNINLA